MNKTISINIGGFVFNIEENAYQQLFNYLQAVKNNFSAADEREEIMNDIESRIAELFQDRLSSGKQVIIEKDVDEVIAIMGKPEDYLADEFAGDGGQTFSSSHEKKSTDSAQPGGKRLYRDTENAALGGVCMGLSHYFNVDVVLIRILFVVFAFFGGFSIIAYIVMMLVVPEAKSTNEKLHMRGQSINLDSIKEHFTKIKKDISENARSGKFKQSFNATVDRGVKVGSTFVNAFSRVIGLAFVMGGIFGLILVVTVLFGSSGFFPVFQSGHSESLPDLLAAIYPGELESGIVFFALIFVTMLPLLGMIITGSRLLFKIKKSSGKQSGIRTLAISSSILWLIALAILIITGIDLGMNFRNEISLDYPIAYADSSNVLYVDVATDDKFSNHISLGDVWDEAELIHIEKETIFLGYPELYITERVDSGNFEIVLYKRSNGLSTKNAIEKAENISYPISLADNRLLLPSYFSVPAGDKLRNQQPYVEIRVPVGKQLILGNNIDRINVIVNEGYRYETDSYSNTTWEKIHGKIRCRECKLVPADHIYW